MARRKLYQQEQPLAGVTVEVLSKRRRVKARPRLKLHTDNPQHQRKAGMRYYFPAVHRVTVENVKLLMPHHIIFKDDEPFYDLSLLSPGDFQRFLDTTAWRVPGHASLITNSNFANYAHWMTENLPALSIMRRQDYDLERVLLPATNETYHHKALHALGLVSWRHPKMAGGFVELDSLDFISVLDHSRNMDTVWPESLAQVSERLNQVSIRQTEGKTFPSKIFVARRDSDKRVLKNTDALSEVLSKKGFEEVNLAGLTIFDQAAMFRGADEVVALHGAALANIIYCRPGTRIIEIQSPTLTNSHFLRLAVQFDLDYTLIQEYASEGAHRHSDWEIADLDRVCDLI